MPYKTNTSTSISTTTVSPRHISGNGSTTTTTSTSTSKRKLTRGETARGILTTIGQLQMIGITILVISIGSAVDDFTTSDLVQTNPNYQTTNTYIPIDDPLNNVNYQQYGQDVFGRFFDEQTGYITFLGTIGEIGQNVAACLKDIVGCFTNANDLQAQYDEELNNPQPGTFIDEFGLERFLTLSTYAGSQIGGQQNPYYIYQQMTTSERTWVRDEYGAFSLVEENLFLNYQPSYFYWFGFDNPFTEQWQWGYYKWPSIRQTILNLGV